MDIKENKQGVLVDNTLITRQLHVLINLKLYSYGKYQIHKIYI